MTGLCRGIFRDAAWAVPGGLAGVLSIMVLWWSVYRVWSGSDVRPDRLGLQRVWGQIGLSYLLRLTIAAALLIEAALRGIGPLLWAFGGFMISRWAATTMLSRWPVTRSYGRLSIRRMSDPSGPSDGYPSR